MDLRFYVLATAAFLSGANLRVFDSLLPNIAAEYGVSHAGAAIVVAAFTLSYGLFQIFYGPIGDRYGRLRTVSIATAIVSIGSIGSAFAQNLDWLTALRFLTGIGAAGIIPVSLAWIGDETDYKHRQVSLGNFISFILLGQIFGPSLGGTLAEVSSWRTIFYFFSVAFFIMTVILLMVDLSYRASARPKPSISAGVHPAKTYLSILKNAWCRSILIAVFLEGALFYGSFAFVGAWIQTELNLSYMTIGILLSGFGLGGVLYTISIRKLQTILDEVGFVAVGVSILFVFFLGLPMMDVTALIGGWCVVGGVGFYMFHNTLQTKATEMYPKARGTAISVFAMSLFSGQAIGTISFGALSAAFGYSSSFMVVAVCMLALGGLFMTKLRTNLRSNQPPEI